MKRLERHLTFMDAGDLVTRIYRDGVKSLNRLPIQEPTEAPESTSSPEYRYLVQYYWKCRERGDFESSPRIEILRLVDILEYVDLTHKERKWATQRIRRLRRKEDESDQYI